MKRVAVYRPTGNIVGRVNEVPLHRAGLVRSLHSTKPPRPTQPGHPSVGRRCRNQNIHPFDPSIVTYLSTINSVDSWTDKLFRHFHSSTSWDEVWQMFQETHVKLCTFYSESYWRSSATNLYPFEVACRYSSFRIRLASLQLTRF